MKWLWLLLWDPITAFDLGDDCGQIDHGKVIGFVGFWAILISLFVSGGKVPTLGHTISLLSAVFGSRYWLAFLKSKAAIAREETQRLEITVNETIVKGRAEGGDFEPT
jgi:hypothetical protein